MGIKKIITNELIDVIAWTEGEGEADILVHKYTRPGNAIKMGARLTVREGQMAVFVNEGTIADVFKPGLYRLQTSNLPILTSLRSWKHGFDTPFPCDVYFVATTQKTGLKWGTTNPILMKDKELGMVRIRAYGSYVMQVSDPQRFLTRLIGTSPWVDTYRIDEALRPFIVSAVSDALGKSDIPIMAMVGNYETIGQFVRQEINQLAADWGFTLPQFAIENISLPPNVEEAVDKRTSMEIVGDVERFTRYQIAEAVREASQANGNSQAGLGAGLGAGMAMAQQMTAAMAPAQAPTTLAPPELHFHVVIQGEKKGPLTLAQISTMIQAEQLRPTDLVWRAGLVNWLPAKDLTELSAIFAQVPPPIPR